MLIFDRFPSTERATEFVAAVKDRYALDGEVYASQDESDAADPFPFELTPPIALIERPPLTAPRKLEAEIENFVQGFDGVFAGT